MNSVASFLIQNAFEAFIASLVAVGLFALGHLIIAGLKEIE